MLTERDTKIVEMTLGGQTQKEAGQAVGITQQAVSKRLKEPEVQEMVKQQSARLVGKLERAVDNIGYAIDYYQSKPEVVKLHDKTGKEIGAKLLVDEQLRDHGFKASIRVAQNAGALPGDGVSVYVQNNIYNDNRDMTLPPEIARLLNAQVPGETYDVEYEEIGK